MDPWSARVNPESRSSMRSRSARQPRHPDLIDRKLGHNIGRYILQSFLAGVVIAIVLLLLDAVHQTAIIASLGASSFIVFAAPTAVSAQPRRLIGGYVAGTIVGLVCSVVARAVAPEGATEWNLVHIGLGALAVAFSILLMTITNTEHPPAAGIALAYVINEWTGATLIVVMGAVLVLAASKLLLRDLLLDLV